MGQGGLEPPFPDFQTGTLPLELPTRDFPLRLSAANGLRSRRLPVDNRTLCRMSYGGDNSFDRQERQGTPRKKRYCFCVFFCLSSFVFPWRSLAPLAVQ